MKELDDFYNRMKSGEVLTFQGAEVYWTPDEGQRDRDFMTDCITVNVKMSGYYKIITFSKEACEEVDFVESEVSRLISKILI